MSLDHEGSSKTSGEEGATGHGLVSGTSVLGWHAGGGGGGARCDWGLAGWWDGGAGGGTGWWGLDLAVTAIMR